jgi:electron-transferring-flavoprotein dehydrogenase
MTGVLLAEGVVELARDGKPFTRENLEASYVRRRRASWVESESRVAERARNGFQRGFIQGVIGMALAGFTGGKLAFSDKSAQSGRKLPSLDGFSRGRIPASDLQGIAKECETTGKPLHDALMNRAGWPEIPFDEQLLVTHQDALLLGGKVQAPAGFADHVAFRAPLLCETCAARVCIELCSGQALTPGPTGVPLFDREKCIHCGVCLWNCSQTDPNGPERGNIVFRAGAGGLHSAEN